jgi:hypothetical protein
VDDFEKGLVGKPCAKCQTQSFTVVDKKDVVDDLAELSELANTDVEVISGETEEGQMLKNAFSGIAAILRFKMQAKTQIFKATLPVWFYFNYLRYLSSRTYLSLVDY